MKLSPNCSCVNRDGSRCGRKVTDGSQPPVCHVHKLAAQGRGTSQLIPTADDPIDEVAILRKLAKDPKPEVRLRAVDLLLSLRTKKEAEQSTSAWEHLLPYATFEQLKQLRDLTARVAAVRSAIATYVEEGGALRVEPAPVRDEPAANAPTIDVVAPDPDEPVTVQSRRGPMRVVRRELDDAWTPEAES